MKKRVFSGALLTLLVCVLFLAFPVQAESSRVFDEAGLFTQQEKQSLEELTKQYIEKTSLDLVIVTTDDTQGKSTRAYADDFYDDNRFGIGADRSGALFLIDMDNREAYISTHGKAIRILTDRRIREITDAAAKKVGAGAYEEAAEIFLEKTDGFVNPNRLGMGLGLLAISMVIGAVAVGIVVYRYQHAFKADQYELRENSRTNLTNRQDIFVRKYVTSRTIPKNNGGGGSSTHTSSSGSTHGGGGSRF